MPMKTLHLQHVSPEDEEAVSGMAIVLDLTLTNHWTSAGLRAEIRHSASRYWALYDHEQVVGFGGFWLIVDEAHLVMLAVHPQWQNMGLGTALLGHMLVEAHRAGAHRATLEVRASNTVALALYERYGFAVLGRRPGYYKDNDEDALILWTPRLDTPAFLAVLAECANRVKQRFYLQGLMLRQQPNP